MRSFPSDEFVRAGVSRGLDGVDLRAPAFPIRDRWATLQLGRVDGDDMVFGDAMHVVEAREDLLARFLALADDPGGSPAPNEAVADFAREYGCFALCADHQRPAAHGLVEGGSVRSADFAFAVDLHENMQIQLGDPFRFADHGCSEGRLSELRCRPSRRESFSTWRDIANRFAAVVRLKEHLHEEEQTPADLWQRLGYRNAQDIARGDLDDRREHLADHITEEVINSGLRVVLVWDAAQKRFDVEYAAATPYGLPAWLTWRLAQAAARMKDLYRCDGCGDWFGVDTSERRPRSDQRKFCRSCKAKKVSVLLAKRDFREGRSKPRKRS
jgi:hypothetical protein